MNSSHRRFEKNPRVGKTGPAMLSSNPPGEWKELSANGLGLVWAGFVVWTPLETFGMLWTRNRSIPNDRKITCPVVVDAEPSPVVTQQ